MKRNHETKRLVLNKMTLAHLYDGQMNRIKAGSFCDSNVNSSCPPNPPDTTCTHIETEGASCNVLKTDPKVTL